MKTCFLPITVLFLVLASCSKLESKSPTAVSGSEEGKLEASAIETGHAGCLFTEDVMIETCEVIVGPEGSITVYKDACLKNNRGKWLTEGCPQSAMTSKCSATTKQNYGFFTYTYAPNSDVAEIERLSGVSVFDTMKNACLKKNDLGYAATFVKY